MKEREREKGGGERRERLLFLSCKDKKYLLMMSFLDREESKKEKNRLKLIFPQIYPRRRKRIKIEKKIT